MKTIIALLLIFCAFSLNAQTLWEVDPKAIPNEIGGVDTVKYISGRVISGNISNTANSNFEFVIGFHSPDRGLIRIQNFSQGSFAQNLAAKGFPQPVAEQVAAQKWEEVIPYLLGNNYAQKIIAIDELLSSYGYTRKK